VKTSNLNLFYAGLVLLIGLTACRKERLLSKVDTEDVYCIFRAEYHAEDDITRYIAQFRCKKEKGDYVVLDENASVSCNGQILPYDDTEYSYIFEQPGTIDSAHFSWTDLNGRQYKNSVRMADYIDFPVGFDSLMSISFPFFEFAWQGPPILRSNESAVLYVNGGENHEYGRFRRRYPDSYTFRQDSLGATKLYIRDSMDLSRNLLQFQREINKDLQEKTAAGGKIQAFYMLEVRR
jgi:hypothetical protein